LYLFIIIDTYCFSWMG